ncbi:hypothetical protein C479_11540 [Halovivax asiaticus JCM 14624]|uniref:DUF309 domain-containing protein n=1 Tax=Halovivax asiaticus JCM 14624 TaxID=1227490 RepID=M0BGM1_9EURY|nr:DUF309 domain-containing protein [Halovivax asiaticus]ELZ09448.1 hypothetical protein C479_11540 [Halovivax asiaticus JCM 14624]
MRAPLRAGIAVYNDGHYHAAHDAWETHWLDLETGTDDERLLHGLIQFTAAVHHAHRGNWEGAVGLAESGREYLREFGDVYRGCNVGDVRRYGRRLKADPEVIERRQPLSLTHEGERLSLADCTPEETVIAAKVLAEEWGYDDAPIGTAGAYALADLDAGQDGGPFLALLFDFVREDAADRPLIVQRLRAHVDRRDARESAVEGLFDER